MNKFAKPTEHDFEILCDLLNDMKDAAEEIARSRRSSSGHTHQGGTQPMNQLTQPTNHFSGTFNAGGGKMVPRGVVQFRWRSDEFLTE